MSSIINFSLLTFAVLLLFVYSTALNCLNDKHRPQIHFSPEKHWLNDPNGLIYLDGEYHMFYQYYPNGTIWGPMHWGHAISTDLIHWEELPIALFPDHLGMIFSGSAVLDSRNTSGLQIGDNPPIVAIFTQANNHQQQSIAVSNDKGRTFQTYSKNPVLPNSALPDFRDPKIHEIDGKWIMSLSVGDRIAFYSSSNLINWSALSEFGANPQQGSHGGVWECPDLLSFDLNGRKVWVLLVSINPGGPNLGSVTQYFIGDFDGNTFRKFGIEQDLWMDWGPDNYAGVTFANEPKNRKLLIAWMSNWLYGPVLPTEDWRGQMTLPRVLELKRIYGKVRLASSPAQELELLRNSSQFYEITQPLIIKSGIIHDFTNDMLFKNPLLEIDVVFDTNLVCHDPTASFQLCFFNALYEELCVGYNYRANQIYLDRGRSGTVNFDQNFGRRAIAKRETRNKILQLKLYLDTSAIELFADGGVTAMTALYYPTDPLVGVNIAFNSADPHDQLIVQSIKIHGLKSIYNC